MNHLSQQVCGPLMGLLLVLGALVSTVASAEKYNSNSFYGHVPTTEELVRALTPTRGLREKPLKVNLMVQFEFGSAKLTADARKILNNLGRALNNTMLSNYTFLIEGHTDSIGSEDYNQQLSEARADSVKQYLATELAVAPDRLRAIGKGESSPFENVPPESAVNRRVKVVNLR